MTPRFALSLFVMLSALGCGAATGLPADEIAADGGAGTALPTTTPTTPSNPPTTPASRPRDARFHGYWALEERYPHATYAAAALELVKDGTLVRFELKSMGTPAERMTRVERNDGVWCEFGSTWWSDGPTRLVIDGVCSDGKRRDIVVGFTSPPNNTKTPADTGVTSVGGETGWRDPKPWGWRFRKCAGPYSCLAE